MIDQDQAKTRRSDSDIIPISVANPHDMLNQREMDLLISQLTLSKGQSSLICVEYHDPAVRDCVVEQLRARFLLSKVVTISSTETDAFDSAVKQVGSDLCEALLIVGLEVNLLTTDQETLGDTWTSLNAGRDVWRQRFNCPVVFFLNKEVLKVLQPNAPDLHSRMSFREIQ